jgi:hypothetical protein
VFEKAQRKVAECTFFLHQLCETQDPDTTEFFFNALLNAGKNVVNALYAQIALCERAHFPATLVTPKDKKAYNHQVKTVCQGYLKAWKRTRCPPHAALFNALQKVRDIVTHTESPGVQYLPKTEEHRELRPIPSDPHYAAVYISYLHTGRLSAHITVTTTTYEVGVDAPEPSKKRVQAWFRQYCKGKATVDLPVAATTYTDLLGSLVTYFETYYVASTPA